MTSSARTHERLLVASTIMLLAGTCALDLALPADAAIVALYIVPILFSLLSAQPWFTLAATIVSLSFATLGFLPWLSDGSGEWMAPAQRALTLVVVTAVACLILFYRRLAEEECAATLRQREYAMAGLASLRGIAPVGPSCGHVREDDDPRACLETYPETRRDAPGGRNLFRTAGKGFVSAPHSVTGKHTASLC